MAVNFSWKISALDLSKTHEQFEDLILNVHWRLEATDDVDDLTVDVFGADSLEEPEAGVFTPFSEVTKEMVVGWLEAKFSIPSSEEESGKTRLQRLHELLNKQLEEKRQPKIITSSPPWEE